MKLCWNKTPGSVCAARATRAPDAAWVAMAAPLVGLLAMAWIFSASSARGAEAPPAPQTPAEESGAVERQRIDITLDPAGLPEADRIRSEERIRAITEALESDLPLLVSYDPRETLGESLAILENHGVDLGPTAIINFDTLSAWIPAGRETRQRLGELPFVAKLRKPATPVPAGIFDSEGIEATGADLAHLGENAPPITGSGITVAIIDTEWEALNAVIEDSGDELYEIPTTDMWFETTSNNFFNIDVAGQGNREHGTAAAEVVYEMAPGAQIIPYRVRDVAGIGFAIRHAAEQGYDIILVALTHIQTMQDPEGILSGGSNPFRDDIDYAVALDSVVVVPAGNEALRHFASEYSPCAECEIGHPQYLCNDADNPEYHKFLDEFSEQSLLPLTFDDDHYDAESADLTCWSAIESGFDETKFKFRLHKFDEGSDNFEPVCAGDSGLTNVDGTRTNLGGTFTKSVSIFDNDFDEQYYYISLEYTGDPIAQWPDFRIACGTGVEEFLFITSEGSISDLGVVPNALTISEVDAFFEDELTETSSRGPVPSGQKPEIGGPGIVENFTVTEFDFVADWTFNGTSAASAHVAAIAALLQEYRVDNGMAKLSPAEVKKWLMNAAIDIEEPWTDDKVGAGFVQVPKLIYEGEVGPLDYYPLAAPCRALDTRFDTPLGGGAAAQMQGGDERAFIVAGAGSACGVPADAEAVSATVTVVNPAAGGFLTLFPGDELLPGVSSVNFPAGGVTNNNLFLKLSASGTIRGYTPTGPIHTILDINGYFGTSQ